MDFQKFVIFQYFRGQMFRLFYVRYVCSARRAEGRRSLNQPRIEWKIRCFFMHRTQLRYLLRRRLRKSLRMRLSAAALRRRRPFTPWRIKSCRPLSFNQRWRLRTRADRPRPQKLRSTTAEEATRYRRSLLPPTESQSVREHRDIHPQDYFLRINNIPSALY